MPKDLKLNIFTRNMLKLSLLTIAIVAVSSIAAQVAEWGQCGGDGYNGPRTCDAGLKCYKQHQWYSQCLRNGCPAGWSCVEETEKSDNRGVGLYQQCGGLFISISINILNECTN